MELVSAIIISEWLGISTTRVRELAAKGIIPKEAHGKYELRPVIAAYVANLRDQAKRVGRPLGNPEARTARERLTEAQAALAEAKADAARGTLVRAADVEREWASVLRDVRSTLLAVPSRVGSKLPHLTAHDVAEIEREIKATLERLADGRCNQR